MSEIVSFQTILEERYFVYALSTITSRSLADLRDGLKPVHRRLILAMYELNLNPSSGYKKCARIVGDVIGKFHPHGDVAVYDALVRMAQSFSMRYPIIEGQGNFGSIDGDNQAAMRYTEAKLTPYAMFLLQDIEFDTVDFKLTYDGSEREPVVLPASLPNILANGAEGIAVGMATSIPPHNILELLDMCKILINNPEASYDELLEKFLGPDLPTGGVLIIDNEQMKQYYQSGKGSFRVRALWHKEDVKNGKYNIIITQIPYQVTKRRIIEQLASLYQEKKLSFIESFQDYSADDIKLVITPKNKELDPEAVMQQLFALTDLEAKLQLNMNVLDKDNKPSVFGIKEILLQFLDHRRVLLRRKINYQLKSLYARLEVLRGLKVAHLNLDEVIAIIRNEDDPKTIMMERFNITDSQAEAILNMRLRALKKLEEQQILKEEADVVAKIESLQLIISNDENVNADIIKEIKKMHKELSAVSWYHRKTIRLSEVVNKELVLESYPVTVSLSKHGWLKSVKEHDQTKVKYRDGDQQKFIIFAMSDQDICIISSSGKCYTLAIGAIGSTKVEGEPLKFMLNFDDSEEVVSFFVLNQSSSYLLISATGYGFATQGSEMIARTKAGKNLMILDKSDFFGCYELNADYILIFGSNRKLIVLKSSDIPIMKRGKGVVLQKLKGCTVEAVKVCNTKDLEAILPGNKVHFWLAKRGSAGRLILGRFDIM